MITTILVSFEMIKSHAWRIFKHVLLLCSVVEYVDHVLALQVKHGRKSGGSMRDITNARVIM